MPKLTDTSKYEILYDKPAGEYDAAEVGGIRTKSIRAGESLEVEAFPIVRIDDGARRERKARQSSRQQEEINLRNTRKRVRRLAEANFDEGDMFWTGTYAYPQYAPGFASREDILQEMEELGCPEDDKAVRRDVKNFLRRIRRRVEALGGDPKGVKYIYVIESTKEPRDTDPHPMPTHYHVHAILHAPGLSREDVEEMWNKGYSNVKRLDLSNNGLAALASYLTKQRRCLRRWEHSRNLKEPSERVSHRKISRRRAAQIAADVQYRGREIMESIYPDYRLEELEVRYSDFVAGAYIYARMRRKPGQGRRT